MFFTPFKIQSWKFQGSYLTLLWLMLCGLTDGTTVPVRNLSLTTFGDVKLALYEIRWRRG
jgi:hypothetical protein